MVGNEPAVLVEFDFEGETVSRPGMPAARLAGRPGRYHVAPGHAASPRPGPVVIWRSDAFSPIRLGIAGQFSRVSDAVPGGRRHMSVRTKAVLPQPSKRPRRRRAGPSKSPFSATSAGVVLLVAMAAAFAA